jgi:hypothetical protein
MALFILHVVCASVVSFFDIFYGNIASFFNMSDSQTQERERDKKECAPLSELSFNSLCSPVSICIFFSGSERDTQKILQLEKLVGC